MKYKRRSCITSSMIILTKNQFVSMKYNLKFTILFASVTTTLAILASIAYVKNSANLIDVCEKYEKLSEEYNKIYEDYTDLCNKTSKSIEYMEDCEEQIVSLCEINSELEEQNKSLVSSNEEFYNTIEMYREREELYNKYEYAISRSNNTRTDITYDQLKLVEDLCKEKDIDTDLVLSICMVESSGTEKAKNKDSSARGYGQILSDTGKYTYEKLMKAGTYDHSLALDGTTNLKMMIEYIDFLDDRNSSLYGVIEDYRGDSLEVSDYITELDKYLSKKGKLVSLLSR